jgi:hypothetical protein
LARNVNRVVFCVLADLLVEKLFPSRGVLAVVFAHLPPSSLAAIARSLRRTGETAESDDDSAVLANAKLGPGEALAAAAALASSLMKPPKLGQGPALMLTLVSVFNTFLRCPFL